MSLAIDNQLADRASVRAFAMTDLRVTDSSAELLAEIERVSAELRARFPDPASAGDRLGAARRLFRALGLDPTRTRPASEALLRRVLQGKGLYKVSSAVDAANLVSLSLALPVGLYDLAKIEPLDARATFRLGLAGEAYPGIGKEEIHLEGRPCLADRLGPFGNPSSDSARTQVTMATSSLFFVLFAPVDVEAERLDEHAATAADMMRRWNGGTLQG